MRCTQGGYFIFIGWFFVHDGESESEHNEPDENGFLSSSIIFDFNRVMDIGIHS